MPLVDVYEKGDGPQVVKPYELEGRSVVAVRVAGDSMAPHYREGDVLFYSRNSNGVPSEALGRICICEDVDGMGWVKIVREDTQDQTFRLISINDAQPRMDGVRLVWASPVLVHRAAEFVETEEQ